MILKKIKNNISRVLLLFTLFSFQQDSSEKCSSEELKKMTINQLGIYTYDTYKTFDFSFSLQKNLQEIEVPLYSWNSYNFIFNMKYLPADVNIDIYDKPYTSKKRTLIFSSKDNEKYGTLLAFNTKHSYRKLYVDFVTQPSNGEFSKGCLLMVIGFKTGEEHEF